MFETDEITGFHSTREHLFLSYNIQYKYHDQQRYNLQCCGSGFVWGRFLESVSLRLQIRIREDVKKSIQARIWIRLILHTDLHH